MVIPYIEKWMRTYCGEGNSTTNVTVLDERIFPTIALSLSLSRFNLARSCEIEEEPRCFTISMLKDGVKFPNRDVDEVECIMEHLDVFLKEIRRITAAMMTPTTSTARRFEGILDMFTVTSWVAPKKRKKKRGGLRAFLLWDVLSYYNWQHLFTIPTDVK
jgi:hypothetical protein